MGVDEGNKFTSLEDLKTLFDNRGIKEIERLRDKLKSEASWLSYTRRAKTR
jgi:hypothetical protein